MLVRYSLFASKGGIPIEVKNNYKPLPFMVVSILFGSEYETD